MSNYNTKLNIAVIGCGNWGKNHIRVLHELGALHSISDQNTTSATAYSTLYNVPFYNFEEMIANTTIQGIVIATPAHTHFELAMRCLQSGKSVFVEKPLTLTINEAQQLDQYATKQNLTLMIGHLLQYHTGFLKIKELKENGSLGKLQYIYSNRLNLGKFRTEEDIWWSFAPHDVSMILALIDALPSTVVAREAKYLQHTLADTTMAHLTFPKGEQAHIFVSWLHPYKEQKLIVIAEKAMLVFDDTQPWESKLQLYPYPTQWADGLPAPCQSQAENIHLEKSEPLKKQAQHFLDCISQNSTPITNGAEAIRVLQVLIAAKVSIDSTDSIHQSQEN